MASASTRSLGDRHRRQIGKKVVEQDLLGQERQERDHQRQRRHADHVAEVRAGRREDVLQRVGKHAPPFVDRARQDRQVVLQKDEVGTLACDVHGSVHRDADIGRVQRRGIVDAVTEIANHVPRVAQRPDDAFLLAGVDFREDGGAVGDVPERLVVHLAQLGAGQDATGLEPDGLRHMRRHATAVAGDDLQRDAAPFQLPDRLGGVGLRRVEEQQEAFEHHRLLVVYRIAFASLDGSSGDPQHAEAFVGPGGRAFAELLMCGLAHRRGGRTSAPAGACSEHPVERALGDQCVVVLPRFPHRNRQPLAHEVVRDLLALGPVVERERGARGADGFVERIGQAGLQPRVQCGQFQHVVGRLPLGVGGAVQPHHAGSERPGLVGR